MDLKIATDELEQPKATCKPPKDPVIEAMETFMKETENVELQSPTVNKGKLYDTENLLHILGSKTSKSCVGCPPPLDRPKMRVLPKRRKTLEKNEGPPPKKGKSIKTTKKSAVRLQYAKIHTIPTFKCDVCREIRPPRKRRATRIHYCKSHKQKLREIDIRNDSKVGRNNSTVKVKQEGVVIDLTNLGENSCYMLLNFGEQFGVEETSFEISDELAAIQYYKVTTRIIASELALVTVPDVRDDLSVPVVDLTKPDEEKGPSVVVSEKECAKTILPIIYRFHEMSLGFDDVEKLRDGAGFPAKSKVIGHHLIQTLSELFVKNINMARFLEFVVSKMEERYGLMLGTATVAHYLKMMFDENRHYCRNRLTRFLLKEIDNYFCLAKSESVIFVEDVNGVIDLEVEVFTQNQLRQLADQIKQYHELLGYAVTVDVDEEYDDDYVFSRKEEKVNTN